MSSVTPPDGAAAEMLAVVAVELAAIARSSSLRVLERLEVPVRLVAPGRGTTRARLEQLRRRCCTAAGLVGPSGRDQPGNRCS